MLTVTIDDRTVRVPEGTTILEAARLAGIVIPTLCYRDGCRPETSCLVCVVRVDRGNRLVPACATKVSDDMTVESETPEVLAARKTALELLLGDHLGDCLGPCHTVCPARMDIPRMIRHIATGEMDEAARVVLEHIPIPSILGRICPAPCEKACRRGDVDSPVAIKLLKRFVGDYLLGRETPRPVHCRPESGKRVAIVGAGPAGLSAAWYLRRMGHACTIIDDRPEPGGMLRYGVTEDALPPRVLDGEVGAILAAGVELRSGVRVGADLPLAALRDEFDAVVLATGDPAQGTGVGVEIIPERATHETGLPGVFVAGSALTPSRSAVRAVGSGRSAALAVNEFLHGRAPKGEQRPYTVRMGRLSPEELAEFAADTPKHGRINPSAGEALGFLDEEAKAEADRCLHCDCAGLEKCALRLWGMKYGADLRNWSGNERTFRRETSHPNLIYEPGKCIACGLCVQIAEGEREAMGLSFIGRGFDLRVGAPLGADMREAISGLALECAQACPTGALVYVHQPVPIRTSPDTEASESA
ncbi:MAG: (2Fe-2S)-binding protein [Armatimonadetes bacterium]|nr:(2Fe-2S)-binding protein [Armatimonadota bacterium]